MKITATNPDLVSFEGSRASDAKASGENFGNLLSQMVNEVNRIQQDGNQKITGALLGKEDLHEAMLALEKTNLGIKLLLQVRNKMIQAYEELSRMPL